MSEKRLATAVIQQAIDDMLAPIPTPNRKRDNEGRTALKEWRHDREQAINFLCRTGFGGEWRESREFWCAVADIDPKALQERMISALLNNKLAA